MDTTVEQQYRTLTQGAGYCVLPGRTQIELTGNDRSRFLHGLCTNDIQQLQPQTGCEAFLTNVQGKVAGYVYVYCNPESLVLDTVSGESEQIVAGLDRYLIREDVELSDRTAEWTEILVSGARAGELLTSELGWKPAASTGIYHGPLDCDQLAVARRVSFCGPESYFINGPTESVDSCLERLRSAGFEECGQEAVEVARIEAGTPIFGIDVTSDNLPQEVGRDKLAISFDKGCYLGQETIARLDALGHVNRLLVGLRFDGESVPQAGSILKVDDKPVARVTSACWSPALNAALGLAYVRRGYMEAGARIESPDGVAEVVPFPSGAVI